MTSPVDIRPDHLEIVQGILREHLPVGVKVWVFGSRANWSTKDSSDLDIALEGENKLSHKLLGALKDAFEDSTLPYTVDVVDLHAVSHDFKQIVEEQRVALSSVSALERVGGAWREVALGNLIDIKHGYAFKGAFIHDESVGDVLLTPGNFAIGGGFQAGKTKHYNGTVPSEFVLSENDLLVTMTDLSKQADTLGYPALIPASPNGLRFLHNQRLGKVVLRDPESTHKRYIYYVLCSKEYRDEVLASATGTTVKHTSPERIKRYRFPLPPLPEQRTITHVLGTLDDKIELNRRMNETLEEMARALFKSWFVDFDPVRAKMEGHWRRGKSLPGLPADHYDLFPDRLVDSELGEIPEGWEVRRLGDCIDVERGLSYKGSGLSSSGVPMHNLNSIYEGGGYKDGGIKYYNGDYQPRHIVKPGEVIVANTEQGHDRLLIGFAAIVPKRFGDRGLFSHHIYQVRPKSSLGLTQEYICQLLNTQVMHDTVSGYATGTTVNMLPIDALRIPGIVVPNIQPVTTFSTIAEAARIRREQVIEESRSLAAQRDSLLPRLVSGEMGVA